jgi:hypothetical protein
MSTESNRAAAQALAAVNPASARAASAALSRVPESKEAEQVELLKTVDLDWRIDFAWKIFNQNQELIRSTDQKIYNLIVMSTLLISLSSANVERFVVRPEARQFVLGVLVLACVNFFVHALATLLARAGQAGPAEPKSLIFCNHIAALGSVAQYRSNFGAASREMMLDDLLAQIAALSDILEKKLKNYKRSWIAASLEVGAFLLMVLVGHFL